MQCMKETVDQKQIIQALGTVKSELVGVFVWLRICNKVH